MENVTTVYFKRAVQILLTEDEFEVIKDELSSVCVEQRIAFWNLIQAGFSTKLAFKNCKNLYELKEMHNLEYEELITLILFNSRDLNIGIYSKGIAIYELN